MTGENQKLRELLHEAQVDRQKLKEERATVESERESMRQNATEKNRQLEAKLERRTRESTELADRITKLNGTVATLRTNDKTSKEHNVELTNQILEQKRRLTDLHSESKNKDDRISLLESQLHDREVEIDAARSSFNNKVIFVRPVAKFPLIFA